MYESVLDEFEARDLSLATLGELALIGNTAARYGGLAGAPEDAAVGPVTINLVRRALGPPPTEVLACPPTLADVRER